MNCKMIIEYDGTQFFGWQQQPKHRTVQGEIVKALSFYAKEEVQIEGSGRTDRGVHADGQVASFNWPGPIPVERLKMVLNKRLPEDIHIRNVEPASKDDFHARFDAKGKVYTYRFLLADEPKPTFRNIMARIPTTVDTLAMEEAARAMVGTHDFKAFMASGSFVTDTVRTVFDVQVRRTGNYMAVRFFGSGFLYNMVRIMSGLLIDVGLGKKQPGDILPIILSGDRTRAERTAPASGLTLTQVFYSEEEMTQKRQEEWSA